MNKSYLSGERMLSLFGKLSPNDAEKPFLISSLQDFEGSLLLLSDSKWPSMIMLLWSACEKMLRATICQNGNMEDRVSAKSENTSALDLQKIFENGNTGLSGALREKSHALRKLRNRIAHHGSSPEDDFICLNSFFRGGCNYFEHLVKGVTGRGLEELLSDEGKWFWDIFKLTRKGVFLFNESSQDPEIMYGMFFLAHAAKKIFIIKHRNQNLTPIFGLVTGYVLEGDDEHGILSLAKADAYQKIMRACQKDGLWVCPGAVKKEEDSEKLLTKDLCIECPICGDSGIIGYRVSEGEGGATTFESIELFCCLDDACVIAGIPFTSRAFNKSFFGDQITPECKLFLSSEKIDHAFLSPYAGNSWEI